MIGSSIIRELGLDPAGRPAKSTQSIIAKLLRLRTRLSRMQDITGCRLEVANIPEQNRVVSQIATFYPGAQIDDLRIEPSHGYRAVHVIVKVAGFSVEIQVRTPLQNSWAQATESLADSLDPEIKYGGGRNNCAMFSNLWPLELRVSKITKQVSLRCAQVFQAEFCRRNFPRWKQIC